MGYTSSLLAIVTEYTCVLRLFGRARTDSRAGPYNLQQARSATISPELMDTGKL